MKSSRAFKDKAYYQLSKIGKAVSSPKRLEILDLLTQGAKSVEMIAKLTEMSIGNASQHLHVLFDANMVEFEKRGQFSYYYIADEMVSDFFIAMSRLSERMNAEIRQLQNDLYENNENLERINLEELITKMKSGNVMLIDVRPEDEFNVLHIPGANSIPLEKLESNTNLFSKKTEVVAYCRGKYCLLSVEAVEILKSHGFKARRFEESALEWNKAHKNDEVRKTSETQ